MSNTAGSNSKEETVAAAKRKLSTSATQGASDTQIKRSKSGSDAVDGSAAEEVAVPVATAPESKGSTDGDSKDEKSPSDGQEKAVDTFYLWDDALRPLLEDGEGSEGALRLKSAVLKVWSKIKHLPKEEQEEAIGGDEDEDEENGGLAEVSMCQWFVEVEDESHESGAGKRLLEMHEAKSKEKDAWWWELDLQRKKPDDSAAALQVKLKRVLGWDEVDERDGVWWVTDLRAAGEDGDKAMTLFADYLASDID